MSSEQDKTLILELLDETVARLNAMASLIVDAEAMAHAAMTELERLRDVQAEADATRGRALELQRALSLATGAATMLSSLLDDVRTWIAEMDGYRSTTET